jgi:hypothetical protein
LQQTPSAQKVESHSALAPQGAPIGLGPQLPPRQGFPFAQSASVVHVERHLFVLVLQMYGAQTVVEPVRQLPVPSQTWVPTIAAPLQVPCLQTVPTTAYRHAPVPSQVPSCPHGSFVSFLHWLGSEGSTPAGVIVQVPSDVASAHVMQAPLQAMLQQSPSTQKLLLHSAAQPHARPLSFLAPLLPHPPSGARGRSAVPPPSVLTTIMSTAPPSRPPRPPTPPSGEPPLLCPPPQPATRSTRSATAFPPNFTDPPRRCVLNKCATPNYLPLPVTTMRNEKSSALNGTRRQFGANIPAREYGFGVLAA